MEIGDIVKIKPTWRSRMYERYWGGELYEDDGRIVELIKGQNKETVGYRVKFPTVTTWDIWNESHTSEGFIWPFRLDDIELSETTKIKFFDEERRTSAQLATTKLAAIRLKQEGISTNEIAERFNVNRRTIHRWTN